MIFLGTVHHPADYFYYLSQFAQGAYQTFMTVDLYTSENLSPTFVGWSNVLIGKLFILFGFSPMIAYHVSVAILTIFLFFTAYFLCLYVLKSRFFAIVSLYLFMLFHAFPILREGKPSYGDYWNNYAVPRVRIGAVPHQLLLSITSMLLVFGIFLWTQNKHSWKTLLLISCSSLILGSLQPALWALITGSMFFSIVISVRHTKPIPLNSLLLCVLATATGAIPIIYLTRLFQTLPFSQLKLWEATQQTLLTPEHFLVATGPIIVVALISIPILLKHSDIKRIFLVIFSTLSLTLFLSPLPRYIGISHVRFMSTLVILSLALIATHGLRPLLQAKQVWLKWMTYIFIIGLSLVLIPNHFKTIEISSTFTPNNLYQYLPVKDYDFFREIASKSQPTDTFLVIAPYNELFPALSGRRSYNGHPLLTIQSAKKDALAASFFADTQSNEAMRQFLLSNGIRWVISTQNQQKLKSAQWASIRAKTNNLVLYAIQ